MNNFQAVGESTVRINLVIFYEAIMQILITVVYCYIQQIYFCKFFDIL